MGRQAAGKTLASLVVAFIAQPTWKQKDLERRASVGRRAVQQALFALQEAGLPLEREEDHPHVYWSVPRSWQPGRGTGLRPVDHLAVTRLVARHPRTAERERMLAKLTESAFGRAPMAPNHAAGDVADEILEALEASIENRAPVRMNYFTASRDHRSLRTVSVQRVVYAPYTRFVAYCHSRNGLRWFRADRVSNIQHDTSFTFLQVDAKEVDRFVEGSIDGYAAPGDPIACTFFVRDRESRWVIKNLPRELTPMVDAAPDGHRVVVWTTATEILARYLAGLGDAARVLQPPELRARVLDIARGVLASNGTSLNVGPARAIRRTK